MLNFIGAPYGIRTRVSALRGPQPELGSRRWDARSQGHQVTYPMIGDPELKVATAYDMPEGAHR
jgi:hypothetical protein